MRSVRRWFAPEREARTLTLEQQRLMMRGSGFKSRSGAHVTEQTAEALTALWRCRTLIADVVSGLPWKVYRDEDGIARQVATPPLVARPSALVRPITWRFQLLMSALTHGNTVGLIADTDALGRPKQIEWAAWNTVHARQASQFSPPEWRIDNAAVPREKVFHFTAWERTGSVFGLSPLVAFADVIGLGLSAQEFAASFYGDGGHPTGVLSSDQALTPDQATDMKSRFKQATATDKLAVLGLGLKFDRVQSTPNDADLTNQLHLNGVQVCQIFGVPPEFVGLGAVGGGSLTYANREQRAIDLLTFTVGWWIRRVEEAFSEIIAQPQYLKIQTGGLLMTDLMTRYRSHDMAIRMGLASVNERRALEDLPPVPGGDVTLWPPYSTTVDQTPGDANVP